MLNLRHYQEKSILSLRNGFVDGHRSQMLYMPTGAGKCLAKGTKVIMADGTKKNVEDIKVGDLLLGANGDYLSVKSTVSGYDDLYRITPKKGESYVVNKDHIISLKLTGFKRKTVCGGVGYSAGDIANVNVIDYLNSSKTFKHCAKAWWPANELNFLNSSNSLPIPPYILGAWLGDGSKHSPSLTGIDQEIIKAWQEYASSIKHKIYIDDQPGKCKSYHITNGNCGGKKKNVLTGHLKNLSLYKCEDKFIPHIYKTASPKDRLDLLAGIVDTDGSMSKGYYDVIAKSKALADDISFVARSLGFQSIVGECFKEATNGNSGKKPYYRLSICGDISRIPCKVSRKKAPLRRQKKSINVSGLSVEYIGKGNYYGFELNGDYKLFLLNDFQVTHNTESAISLLLATRDAGNSAAMVLDRRILCEQTSQRLDKYGIDHGVLMAGHWRFRPDRKIQICSAQTLEARGSFPGLKLMIVDEAHAIRKETADFIKSTSIRTIGLSASPFTKGLANIYTNVVSEITTDELVKEGSLVSLKVFAAKEIDMEGASRVAGEWSHKDATERGIKITGDIVSEWIGKTHEIFGEPRKTIVFCAGVQHGADLSKKFAEAGYNFVSISYKDDDEFKREAIEEFSKPDSLIHGLIATDILTKGFDVPDVMIGISARPFTKSFSSHVQQMGRVMRPCEGKEFAVWLDHSGNYVRFKDDWDDLYHNGVKELSEGKEKPRKEPTKKEKESAKCPKCSHIWPAKSDTCSHCGFVREKRNDVLVLPGQLIDVGATLKAESDEKRSFYHQLLYYCELKGYSDGWAFHQYKTKFGVEPRWAKERKPVTKKVMGWIRSRQIAYAKARAKA